MKKLASVLCALGLGFVLATFAQAATEEERIIERIKAVGSVCIEGDDSCGGAPVAAAASGGAKSGEDIYKASCAACHGAGVLGAPKYGSADWTARLNDKGLETLVTNAINGINNMPARGTCATCSDDEIAATVEYMVNSAP